MIDINIRWYYYYLQQHSSRETPTITIPPNNFKKYYPGTKFNDILIPDSDSEAKWTYHSKFVVFFHENAMFTVEKKASYENP